MEAVEEADSFEEPVQLAKLAAFETPVKPVAALVFAVSAECAVAEAVERDEHVVAVPAGKLAYTWRADAADIVVVVSLTSSGVAVLVVPAALVELVVLVELAELAELVVLVVLVVPVVPVVVFVALVALVVSDRASEEFVAMVETPCVAGDASVALVLGRIDDREYPLVGPGFQNWLLGEKQHFHHDLVFWHTLELDEGYVLNPANLRVHVIVLVHAYLPYLALAHGLADEFGAWANFVDYRPHCIHYISKRYSLRLRVKGRQVWL